MGNVRNWATEWERSTARNGERWTPAEEKRLERLYTKPRKVTGMGKPRSKAMYYAAKVLKRTPCACASRMDELNRSRVRQAAP